MIHINFILISDPSWNVDGRSHLLIRPRPLRYKTFHQSDHIRRTAALIWTESSVRGAFRVIKREKSHSVQKFVHPETYQTFHAACPAGTKTLKR